MKEFEDADRHTASEATRVRNEIATDIANRKVSETAAREQYGFAGA